MSVLQWGVIALNICAFIAMVTAFAVGGWTEVKQELPSDDSDFPPLDYTRYQQY